MFNLSRSKDAMKYYYVEMFKVLINTSLNCIVQTTIWMQVQFYQTYSMHCSIATVMCFFTFVATSVMVRVCVCVCVCMCVCVCVYVCMYTWDHW